jgi:hypothetical protein
LSRGNGSDGSSGGGELAARYKENGLGFFVWEIVWKFYFIVLFFFFFASPPPSLVWDKHLFICGKFRLLFQLLGPTRNLNSFQSLFSSFSFWYLCPNIFYFFIFLYFEFLKKAKSTLTQWEKPTILKMTR